MLRKHFLGLRNKRNISHHFRQQKSHCTTVLSFRDFDISYRSPLLGRQDDEQNLKYVSNWKMLREKSQVSCEVTELTDVGYAGTRHLWNEDRQW